MSDVPARPLGWKLDLLLALAIVVCYGDVLSYGYIWDDQLLATIELGDVYRYSLFGIHVRPVWFLSHLLSSSFVTSPVLDHAVNLLLFGIAAALARRAAELFLGRWFVSLLVALTWRLAHGRLAGCLRYRLAGSWSSPLPSKSVDSSPLIPRSR